MADFCATSRSNFVLVKDVTAAIESLKGFDIPIHRHPENTNAIMLAGCDSDGTFNFSHTEEDTILDLAEWCKAHLAEGQVLVLVSAGAEKLRYISAWAEAYTWKGEVISVNLLDALFRKIYEKLGTSVEVADPSYLNFSEGASTP